MEKNSSECITCFLTLPYPTLVEKIQRLSDQKKELGYVTNTTLLQTYWSVGEYIVMNEQRGDRKARYGSRQLQELAKGLASFLGVGFSRSNISYMRLFYLHFSWDDIQNGKLLWSHYFEILKSETKLEITFYSVMAAKGNWNLRHLKQQMKNKLFYSISLCEIVKLNPGQGFHANFSTFSVA